jgi:hypothetical protein
MAEAWRYRIELWKVKDCASDPDADPAWPISGIAGLGRPGWLRRLKG